MNLQLDEQVYERIRLLAFKSRKSIAEIVRRCVETSLDNVEKDLENEKPSKKISDAL
jgi:predicted DNA-binding protein